MPTTCKSLHAFVHTVELASACGGLSTYTFAMFVGVSMSAHVGLAHMSMCVQEGKAHARAWVEEQRLPRSHRQGSLCTELLPGLSPGAGWAWAD